MSRPAWLVEHTLIFPDNLPITEHLAEIRAALMHHQVIVVAGETGSGKTTQLPKLMLAMGRGTFGQIGHTQPRRIAARSVAQRIAEELLSPLGEAVGYQIRFQKKTSTDSYIKVMTDGILLAELAADPQLKKYDTLIIDEAHERSLNIDFILGYLKWLLPKRPELKIIITSATLDHQRFSSHFNNCPVIEVSGRGFPVEIQYQAWADENKESILHHILRVIHSFADPLGDILIFLSGEHDIRQSSEFLRKQKLPHTEILPLYAKLSSHEQQKIFSPTQAIRRIILATNVAETSLTIPNIRYVIDTGLARIKRYNARSKIQHLPIESISQASANQRAGRCGRTAPGVCVRLYSVEDFALRPAFTEPEILRSHLAHVILHMLQLHLGNAEDFPWLDPPETRYWKDAYQCLEELGAIYFDQTLQYQLTETGRLMAKIPVDPRLAKLLITACEKNCLADMLIIVSALSVADIFLRPLDKRQAADEKHRLFFNPHSDFVTLLNIWYVLNNEQNHLSNKTFKTFCDKHFLSYAKFKDWQNLYHELKQSTQAVFHQTYEQQALVCTDYTPCTESLPYASAKWIALHQSILSGMLTHVAQKQQQGHYLATRLRTLKLFPTSALAKKPPAWIMALELIETKQIYASIAAAIEPEWIEQLAPHLIKKNYSNPHWDSKRGAVIAFERILFFGLTLIEKRRVCYAPIDSALSHEIFLRAALSLRQLNSSCAFFQHNEQMLIELHHLEEKTRSRYFVPDDEWLYAFYQNKIPQTINNRTDCEKWFKQLDEAHKQNLFLRYADFESLENQDIVAAYPSEFIWQDNPLKITYQFSPGDDNDGVTLTVPQALLASLPEAAFTWLVPGLLEEKIHAILKGLNKEQRKALIPLAESAQFFKQQLKQSITQDLFNPLAALISDYIDQTIEPEQLKNIPLAEFLTFNFHVIAEGKIIAQGRQLTELKQRLSVAKPIETNIQHTIYHHWPNQALAEQEKIQQAECSVTHYLALQPQNEGVKKISVESFLVAQQIHQLGVRKLLQCRCKEPLQYVVKKLLTPAILAAGANVAVTNKRSGLSKNQIWSRLEPYLSSFEFFIDDFSSALMGMTFAENFWLIRDAQAFEACYSKNQQDLITNAEMLTAVIQAIIIQLLRITNTDDPVDLTDLFYPGFLAHTPWEWLERYPYYLAAYNAPLPCNEINALQKLKQRHQAILNKTCRAVNCPNRFSLEICQQSSLFYDPLFIISEELLNGFYLIQELEMTLRSPKLKPIEPVSIIRLNKLLDKQN